MTAFDNLTRDWQIFLVHHTHVDIGYTAPQQVILRKHPEYIAQVLDYCTATDHLAEGERFCWTCEVSWTVKAFLERFPERAKEFFRRVQEGRIEITGLYLQLTDLYTEELLAHTMDYAADLAKTQEFTVVTAMNDDVNGWPWGLPKMMAERGIRYFDTAINETRALGVRPRPRPHYWASPDGSRVLHWHGDGYLHGNAFEFDRPGAEERLAEYLKNLEDTGYPHNAIELRISGRAVDNSPPGLWISEAVSQWNARNSKVKLKMVTSRQWFEEIEANWPEELPELKLGWPDWWADGNGSAIYESALVRKAQADIKTADALAKAGRPVDKECLDKAREAAAFFCEHTWGAWCSTDDPDRAESRSQWNHKAQYAYTAAVDASSAVQDAMRSGLAAAECEHFVEVFNPLPWQRTDTVEVVICDDLLCRDRSVILAKDRADEAPPLHLLDLETGERISAAGRAAITDSARCAGQIVTFIARNLPAQGFRRYKIVPEPLEATSEAKTDELTLENMHFKVTIDPISGGINSLINVPTGRELVQPGACTLNQCIYETIEHSEGRERLCGWQGIRRDVPFRRSSPTLRPLPFTQNACSTAFTLEGAWDSGMQLITEIRIYDEIPRVDLVNTLTKQATDCAEAVYQAFPLAGDQPTVYLDVPGTPLRPGLDQVPGTATDWHSIQHYFAAASRDWTTVVASPDVPLVQVNGINTGKWQETLPPHNGLVMSWVLNNYWFTNFPARQGGRITYRYSISGWQGAFDNYQAAKFAQEIRQPLVAIAK